MPDDFKQQIEKKVNSAPIVIFMKGDKTQPQCGFSAQVVSIFNSLGKPFETVDILSNPEIRSRLSEVTNWPTFPQVFVKGKMIGGCDIVTEMYEAGELQPLVAEAFQQ